MWAGEDEAAERDDTNAKEASVETPHKKNRKHRKHKSKKKKRRRKGDKESSSESGAESEVEPPRPLRNTRASSVSASDSEAEEGKGGRDPAQPVSRMLPKGKRGVEKASAATAQKHQVADDNADNDVFPTGGKNGNTNGSVQATSPSAGQDETRPAAGNVRVEGNHGDGSFSHALPDIIPKQEGTALPPPPDNPDLKDQVSVTQRAKVEEREASRSPSPPQAPVIKRSGSSRSRSATPSPSRQQSGGPTGVKTERNVRSRTRSRSTSEANRSPTPPQARQRSHSPSISRSPKSERKSVSLSPKRPLRHSRSPKRDRKLSRSTSRSLSPKRKKAKSPKKSKPQIPIPLLAVEKPEVQVAVPWCLASTQAGRQALGVPLARGPPPEVAIAASLSDETFQVHAAFTAHTLALCRGAEAQAPHKIPESPEKDQVQNTSPPSAVQVQVPRGQEAIPLSRQEEPLATQVLQAFQVPFVVAAIPVKVPISGAPQEER
ncbi:hypothetical protein CRUP_004090 [Coryphaenoides rupestris]|nr:hypothetical protein CRUP_004090 [Coryphaenoides rupestris]